MVAMLADHVIAGEGGISIMVKRGMWRSEEREEGKGKREGR